MRLLRDSRRVAECNLADKLLDALSSAFLAGGEAGPVSSAALMVSSDAGWPETDLRVDYRRGSGRAIEAPLESVVTGAPGLHRPRPWTRLRSSIRCYGRIVKEPLKTRAQVSIHDAQIEVLTLSHRIHANPELAWHEVKAAAWLAENLRRVGFEVRGGVGDLPTAFLATRGSGDLRVGICAEYDALPEIGHACGHNVIAAAAFGAAVGLVEPRRGTWYHVVRYRHTRGRGRRRENTLAGTRSFRRDRCRHDDPSGACQCCPRGAVCGQSSSSQIHRKGIARGGVSRRRCQRCRRLCYRPGRDRTIASVSSQFCTNTRCRNEGRRRAKRHSRRHRRSVVCPGIAHCPNLT